MSANGHFQIEITRAEMVALVKYHCSQAKRIPKRMGDLMMKERCNLLPRMKTLNAIAAEARSLMDFHMSRAKGLTALLKEKRDSELPDRIED